MLLKDSKRSNLLTETTHCKITHLFQCWADYPRQKAHSTSNIFWKETFLYFTVFISIVQNKTRRLCLNLCGIMTKVKYRINQVFSTKICMKMDFTSIRTYKMKMATLWSLTFSKIKINELPCTLYQGLKKAILRYWPEVRNTAADQILQPYHSLEFWLGIKGYQIFL